MTVLTYWNLTAFEKREKERKRKREREKEKKGK